MGPELVVLGIVLMLLGVHPFTTYPASLALLARLRGRPIRGEGQITGGVALCVCAYNEARIIGAKAENMLALRQAMPNLDLLIYVDAANDRTAEVLDAFADRIRVTISPARHGKSHGMNTLVALTDAEFIVFSDANVMFAADAVSRLLQPFRDPSVGCVCGHLIYTSPDGSVTAAMGSAYWRLEEAIKELESRTGSIMGADGSIFAIRRGLHRPPPADIIDDMFVSFSILCDGHRLVRASDALAYEETVSRPEEEFRRKIRIACQAFNVHRLLWPRLVRLAWLDRYKYVSHKLLRWLAIYFMVVGGACAVLGLLLMRQYLAAAILVLAGVVLPSFGLAMRGGPARKLADILVAFVATGLGVARSLRGERFQTWTPPSSARGGTPKA